MHNAVLLPRLRSGVEHCPSALVSACSCDCAPAQHPVLGHSCHGQRRQRKRADTNSDRSGKQMKRTAAWPADRADTDSDRSGKQMNRNAPLLLSFSSPRSPLHIPPCLPSTTTTTPAPVPASSPSRRGDRTRRRTAPFFPPQPPLLRHSDRNRRWALSPPKQTLGPVPPPPLRLHPLASLHLPGVGGTGAPGVALKFEAHRGKSLEGD